MEKNLIIVYDFDGTLTPYPSPQYKILKKCGYDDEKMDELVKNFMKKGFDLHEAYMESLYDIFNRFNIPLRIETFFDNIDNLEFNKGVYEFFNKYKMSNIKHYVVTSGFKEVINKTKISVFLDGIYGINVVSNDKEFKIINYMKDKDKVKAIDDIVKLNHSNLSNVIYFGDGLTDKCAFRYVHNNGGISILIQNKAKDIYSELKDEDIIDFYFKPDYSSGSEIDKYINYRIKNL